MAETSRKRKFVPPPEETETDDLQEPKRNKFNNNTKFVKNIRSTLRKASTRREHKCPYDTKETACYRINRQHIKECAHQFHCSEGDIATFKKDTDTFLSISFEIYNEEKERKGYQDFSISWKSEVGARTGDEKIQFAQSDFKRYDSFYFYFLANLLIHLEEYAEKYTPEFLISLLAEFESSDATGLFTLPIESPMAKKLEYYGVRENTLLGNTTIQDCLKNMPSSVAGGKYIKKRKTLRKYKRSSNKRSSKRSSNKHKRSSHKHKRSSHKHKRSSNKRSSHKRSSNKRIRMKK